MQQRRLPDPQATAELGGRIAAALPPSCRIDLSGELGAGKTTLVRGLLRALGFRGTVRSPTYTLVEPYQVAGHQLYHLDLYRLSDPEELDYLGLRDLLGTTSILLVEWPERAGGALPVADLVITLSLLDPGRQARLVAQTSIGSELLARLQNH